MKVHLATIHILVAVGDDQLPEDAIGECLRHLERSGSIEDWGFVRYGFGRTEDLSIRELPKINLNNYEEGEFYEHLKEIDSEFMLQLDEPEDHSFMKLSLGEFISANQDSVIDGDEQYTELLKLSVGESMIFGGGAAAKTTVKRIQ